MLAADQKELVELAANAGINARGLTVRELRIKFEQLREGALYADQHDLRLDEALKRAEKQLTEPR